MKTFLMTIHEEHVGLTDVKNALYKQPIPVGSAIGIIQPIDIGKYVYMVNDSIQVESSQARDQRFSEATNV